MSESTVIEANEEPLASQIQYFAVSPLKLVVMTLCTLSLYELYWFYKNWCFVQDREKIEISPMLRSFFFPYFFCYSLFQKVRGTAQLNAIKEPLPAGPMAVGWIVANFLGVLPAPYGFASFLSVLFLLPVQDAAKKINSKVSPQHNRNSEFTKENIIAIAIGLPLSIAILAPKEKIGKASLDSLTQLLAAKVGVQTKV